MIALHRDELIDLAKPVVLSDSHPVVAVGQIAEGFIKATFGLEHGTAPEHRRLDQESRPPDVVEVKGRIEGGRLPPGP